MTTWGPDIFKNIILELASLSIIELHAPKRGDYFADGNVLHVNFGREDA